MSFCGYCGSNMPDDMTFCTECGKPLRTVNKSHYTVSAETPILNQSPRSVQITTISQNSKKYEKKTDLSLILTSFFAGIVVLMLMIHFLPKNYGYNSATGSGTAVVSESASHNEQTSTTSSSSSSASSTNNTSSSHTGSTTTASERVQRDGSDVLHRDAQIAFCKLSVPFYWGERAGATSKELELYAEDSKAVAMIKLEVSMNNGDDYSWFKDSSLRERVIAENILYTKIENSYIDSAKYYETETVAGILCTIKPFTYQGVNLSGTLFMVPSNDYKHMVYVIFVQSDNTNYLYDDDFMRILDTIELTDGSYSPD